jgi:hypothetical protein
MKRYLKHNRYIDPFFKITEIWTLKKLAFYKLKLDKSKDFVLKY